MIKDEKQENGNKTETVLPSYFADGKRNLSF